MLAVHFGPLHTVYWWSAALSGPTGATDTELPMQGPAARVTTGPQQREDQACSSHARPPTNAACRPSVTPC
jgi:hypothetical protein